MDEKHASAVDQVVERVTELESELEASSEAATEGDALVRAREVLHRWVDSVTAVVATPGVGRVVLIHENGRESRIASPDLPVLLSAPVEGGHHLVDVLAAFPVAWAALALARRVAAQPRTQDLADEIQPANAALPAA